MMLKQDMNGYLISTSDDADDDKTHKHKSKGKPANIDEQVLKSNIWEQ